MIAIKEIEMPRYIDADAAIDAANRLSLGETDVVRLSMKIVDYLNRMPAADVAPVRHGRWEPYVECLRWRCSECGSFIDIDPIDEIIGKSLPNFCPQCGAKMDEN